MTLRELIQRRECTEQVLDFEVRLLVDDPVEMMTLDRKMNGFGISYKDKIIRLSNEDNVPFMDNEEEDDENGD